MTEVLHITAHLGGGVGKALSGLVLQSAASGAQARHTIVTLEEQEKPQFADLVRSAGCQLLVRPTPQRLCALIKAADVVQLEWWNHPATLAALCSGELPPMRLLVWSHVSGLHNPVIPSGLMAAAHRFLFTSPCSYQAANVAALSPEARDRSFVVSSSGGFAGFPTPAGDSPGALRAGYIGSLNFAKLHPQYVDYLSAVSLPGFGVSLIGDIANREVLEKQCAQAGRPGMLEFRGYTDQVASELASINVLAYLLNPEHYGTTENALIEAMSLGIVPVVLDNPAERQIVEAGRTGLIVGSPDEFAQAIGWLQHHPQERRAMGREAARSVRERFSVENMARQLQAHYEAVHPMEKRSFDFRDIFGPAPADWFLSCQGDPALFTGERPFDPVTDRFKVHGLREKSKGTVFHFRSYFPDDSRLEQWSQKILSLP